jgi:Sigma-70, region 4
MTFREIGRSLGIKESHVQRIYSSAMMKLRRGRNAPKVRLLRELARSKYVPYGSDPTILRPRM